MIIDFHTHTFPSRVSARVIENLSAYGHLAYFTTASTEALTASMQRAGIDYSVNLPVMTRADQVTKVNGDLLRRREELFSSGIITFGGLHPEFEDFRNEIRRLREGGIKGVKLHPAFQGRNANDLLFKRIIGAISEEGMICLLHCGYDISFMDHDFASVPMLLDLINDVQPQKLVLAHMGGWENWDDIERDLAGAPVWMDTAYSLGPVHARPGDEDKVPFKENLSRERFVKLARQHGTDRVLFATDSPWIDQNEYVDFLSSANLTPEERNAVFSGNARRLLDME